MPSPRRTRREKPNVHRIEWEARAEGGCLLVVTMIGGRRVRIVLDNDLRRVLAALIND